MFAAENADQVEFYHEWQSGWLNAFEYWRSADRNPLVVVKQLVMC